MVMWYPAAASVRGQPMLYREYFAVPDERPHTEFARQLREFLLETAHKDIGGPVDALLSMRTRAHRDVWAAQGRFPLVLYHSGAAGSYEDNSVLCEYLATHGYVVITSAFQSGDGQHISNNYGGPRASLADMLFLLEYAGALPFVDVGRAGAIGHSMGAWRVLEALGQKRSPFRAAVSLDTTLEYTAENDPGHATVRRELGRLHPVRAPVLVVASAERHPRFSTWDRLLPGRTELQIPLFEHDDYLLHGILAREMKQDRAADFRREYEKLAVAIRLFFDRALAATPAISSDMRSQTR
jgi:dienelactone hydrolase